LQRAKEAVRQYGLIKGNIKEAMQLAKRNRYSLELMNGINELQVYPATLLLLLKKYDKASAAGKPIVKQAIRRYVDSFSTVRQNFETVFLETRFLTNPADYTLDQNHHKHLANGTINSDWMYLYELPMNTKIKEWLAAKSY
jgi:hypothetical protein